MKVLFTLYRPSTERWTLYSLPTQTLGNKYNGFFFFFLFLFSKFENTWICSDGNGPGLNGTHPDSPIIGADLVVVGFEVFLGFEYARPAPLHLF